MLPALLISALPGLGSAAMVPIAGDPIATTGGQLAGTRLANGVNAYLGVPFAAPPTGDRRWAPPQPIRWDGVFNADRKGPACMQVLRPHDINHYFGEEPTSEDCLYMNIWTPGDARPGAGLPVVVFIYGGGYTIGSSGLANYGGENVARRGAVFVNFNYRVGAMGFMAHPELTRAQGGHSGNYGLMDQQLALEWVRDNIARFGGDPAKVIIMGQSAGAGSVAAQMFNPMAKGLFRGAVMSSGCNFTGDGMTLADAEALGLKMQQALGSDSLAAMRNVPADRILAQQAESQLGLTTQGLRFGGPIIDGYLYPAPHAELLARGALNAVPIIAGYNSDDIAFNNPLSQASTGEQYRSLAQQMYGGDANEFLRLFPLQSQAQARDTAKAVALLAGFELNARTCARYQESVTGQPAYLYRYAHKHPYVPGVKLADQDPATVGAYHTADIPFWFDTLDAYNSLRPTRNWTAADRTLTDVMVNSLLNFAATGNPATEQLAWPAWNANREQRLEIGQTASTVTMPSRQLDWLQTHPAAAVALPPRPVGPRD
ncbi:MAG: carboxylesterase family protein [Gammaproteobacteria bacterium]|nr:carboxylesterase family protein [Gammaproteobacteria bacterium]